MVLEAARDEGQPVQIEPNQAGTGGIHRHGIGAGQDNPRRARRARHRTVALHAGNSVHHGEEALGVARARYQRLVEASEAQLKRLEALAEEMDSPPPIGKIPLLATDVCDISALAQVARHLT